jgi:uncharacterized delta-60 repeat protein
VKTPRHKAIQLKTKPLSVKNSINRSPLRYDFLGVLLLLKSVAALALIFALTLAPDDCAKADSISLDPNFNAPFFAVPNLGSRGVLLPDEKYVMFFNIDTAVDQSTGPIMRFNSDGTLDTTFSFSHDYSGVGGGVAPTTDGKLLIGATKTVYGVFSSLHQVYDILRLNADGSIDQTFGPAQATDGAEVRIITLNPDGTIFVGGRFTAFNGQPTGGIVRLLENGSLDPSFTPPAITCGPNTIGGDGLCGVWADPVIDGDGKILIAGDFVSVNGVSAPGIARLNSDGSVDSSFNPSGFMPANPNSPRPIRGIVIQSDGKIVIGGRLTMEADNFGSIIPLVRLNTDGSADQTYGAYGFNPQPDGFFYMRRLLIQPDDKVIGISRSVYRFNSTDGSLDPTFYNPTLLIHRQFDTDQATAEAFNIAFTNDGGFFIGGIFTDIDDLTGPAGPERWCAAKLHSDGTLDTSFATVHEQGLKIEPGLFRRETDGSTLITFSSLGWDTLSPAIPHNLGRLSTTGTLDTGYDPLASLDPNGPLGPNFLGLGFTGLTDGSLLVTGQRGSSASYGRLLSTGSEDPNFRADPNVSFATAFPQTNGTLVVDGYYPNYSLYFADPSAQNVANGTQVQRLNSDGSIDASFHLDDSIAAATQERDGGGSLTAVYAGSGVLSVTADNKVLFGYASSDSNYHLVRLNSDGSIDSGFTWVSFPISFNPGLVAIIDPQNPGAGYQQISSYRPTDIPVKQAKAVLDSKYVIMGSFNTYGATPAHGLLRINPNGSVDPTFNVGSGAQWTQTQETETFHPSIDNLEVGLDDKLLLTGTFEAFNGTAAPGIISLNPDGTIDTSFVAPVKRQKFDYQPAYLVRQGDGSFLLSGPYSRATDNNSPSFFRLVLPPGVPTPTGSNVSVDQGSVGAASDITTTFGAVGSAGTTSVSVIDPNWAGQLPSGFQITGANLAFEIYTTSSYTSPVTVCFTIASLDDTMRVLHNDGNGLVDVTSSIDTATHTICGTVPSLSPFVIAKAIPGAQVQQPINADGTSVFTVRRGVVPVKFTLTLGGVATCALPPATIAVTRTAGGVIGSVNESTYAGSADSGSNFRISSCQYIYNLNSSALGVGTYRVDIIISGEVAGSATFKLK